MSWFVTSKLKSFHTEGVDSSVSLFFRAQVFVPFEAMKFNTFSCWFSCTASLVLEKNAQSTE